MNKDRVLSLLAYAPVVLLMVFINSLNIFSLKKEESEPYFRWVILIFAVVFLIERYINYARLKSKPYVFSHLLYSLRTILTYFGANIVFVAIVFVIKTMKSGDNMIIGGILILFFALSMCVVYFSWVWVAYRFLKGFVFVVRGEVIKNSWIF